MYVGVDSRDSKGLFAFIPPHILFSVACFLCLFPLGPTSSVKGFWGGTSKKGFEFTQVFATVLTCVIGTSQEPWWWTHMDAASRAHHPGLHWQTWPQTPLSGPGCVDLNNVYSMIKGICHTETSWVAHRTQMSTCPTITSQPYPVGVFGVVCVRMIDLKNYYLWYWLELRTKFIQWVLAWDEDSISNNFF